MPGVKIVAVSATARIPHNLEDQGRAAMRRAK
jgi:hypothetical protein